MVDVSVCGAWTFLCDDMQVQVSCKLCFDIKAQSTVLICLFGYDAVGTQQHHATHHHLAPPPFTL
jgi:hypothetical protein